MATVRVWNPQPRKKKALNREQVANRQDKAVLFLRDVADDPDLADEIDGLSVEEYAQRKGFDIVPNPTKQRKEKPMKREELKELMSEVAKTAASEAVKQTRRTNPATVQPSASPKSDKEKILDRVDDAAAALADGDEDEALDILNGVLEDYDEDVDAS